MATKPRPSRTTAAPASKPQPSAPAEHPAPDPAAANNIWLAGLGALAKAQAEGSKAFEALVKEGIAAQRAAQDMAQQRMDAFTERMETLNQGVTRAAGRWPGLEHIFESRVAQALGALGMPTPQAWADLMARVERLEQALDGSATPKTESNTGAPAARRTQRKRPAP
ncbi:MULTISPECIES: phasin family protein [Ottowia]|uniref:phasin family protein n=1 Tax=Ottowia TaxID=219181 RepID=UPI002B9F7E5B|nr:phasin family protein [Ottowia sp.]HRN75312.1 phasin family protein [Ottowia sp.]HRQ02510.1 phasin family protein [Ottowia sp.]